MKRIIVIFAAVVSLSAAQAFADSFRCPNGNIVSTGDSVSIVSVKCDPPAGTAKRDEPVTRGDGRTVYIEVQEWTYTQGSTLIHSLIFRNGLLAEVRTDGFVQ